MNHFRTPLLATSVTMRHSSRCATTRRDTGFDTFLNFVNTCKKFVAARRVVSEVSCRLHGWLALSVVCAASLYCESGASAQTTNGVVTAWGENSYLQCNIPASANSGVTAIAGGGNHTIALKDGAVLAWGYNGYGQCNVPGAAQSGVTAIAGGSNHTIALKNGAVLAWGYNSYGQCNFLTTAQSGVTAIAGGSNHTIALKGGAVLAWGYNGYGQCTIPASANSGVSAIAGGYAHTTALKNGAVLAWGYNGYGQCLGTNSSGSPITSTANGASVQILGVTLTGVSAIAGGLFHTIALKDGAVLAWGYNGYGQCLGTNSSGSPITSTANGASVQILGVTLSGVSAIAGGGNHTIALKGGAVLAWGYNGNGQCTIPDSANSGVSAIAGGSEHTIALPPIKDCNNNGIHDPVDVAAGAIDLNTDSVPDTCQGLNPYDTTTSSLGIPTANIAVNTTFTGLQPTITDAILTIRAKGDFDAGSAGLEYLTVKINDASPGQKLFETGAVNCSSATNGGVSTATITIPVATFAQYSAAGTLKVTLLPSPSVTASECSTGFITAQLQCVFLTASGDCDSNSQWDLDEIKANPTLDRNTSRTLDFCEIRDNPALDRNNNGQLDSYDISQDPSLDRNLNGQFDSYDISQDPTLDRNNNGVLDSWEIAQNSALDRNNNGVLDSWEISQNPALDRNNNSVLDSWDISQDPTLDRNNNGVLDSWEISQNPALDRNNNGMLDSYDVIVNPSLDCNNNLAIDQYEILDNSLLDCDANGRLDSCDIASKNSPVFAWGSNGNGQCLGTNSSGSPITSTANGASVQILGVTLSGVSAIAGGADHTIALKGGVVLAWGNNGNGQCTIPASASSGVSAIAGGYAHTIALKNGGVLAWGYNGFGQCLGTNSSGSPITSTANGASVQILGVTLSGVSAIAGGGNHTIALKGGAVLAWGYNGYGQCTIPASASSGVSAIAGGSYHTIALKNGEVLAWGYNYYGQCTIPPSASSGVSAIAGGGNHTIALKGGAVLAWGYNYNGQCLGTNSSGSPITSTANGASVQILGVTLSGVSAIAGGADHTIALKNSEVLAWGRNVEGQCTIPASTQSSVIAIAGGYYHTIALRIPVDTNYNSRLDSCEITANAALDRNTNGMLDSFDCAQDPALDCNHNLNIDQYEIVDNELLDCNYNGKIDSCDIANGVADDDSDSHLDVCEWSKGDLDLSGVIDSGDFSILLLYYGEIDPIFGDMDGSGLIDTGDASIILLYFGEVTWP